MKNGLLEVIKGEKKVLLSGGYETLETGLERVGHFQSDYGYG